MEVTITARHMNLSETAQSEFKDRIAHVGRFDQKVKYIDVVCGKEHDKAQMEWKIGVEHHTPVVIHTEAENLTTAIDILMDKAEKALTKNKEIRVERSQKAE
jgi:ribosomal subunit interface protein